MQLNKLRKRKTQYFRTKKVRQQTIDRSFGSKKAIEYYVKSIYNALPKKDREFLSNDYDIDLAINNLVNSIMYYKDNAVIPYESFQELIRKQKRKGYIGTKEYIYKEFRTQEPELYNKYNSYVYRLGYSAMQWFMDKGNVEVKNSIITVDVELPDKYSGRVFYNTLHLKFERSGGFFMNCYMS